MNEAVEGETQDRFEGAMHPRASVTYAKNGRRLEDYLFINLKAWQFVLGLGISLFAALGTIHTVMVYVYEPRLRQTIQEEVKPLSLELAAERAVMQSHLLEEAKSHGESVRRQELEERLARIETKLDAVYRVAR